jgi:hypothetical protein
MVGIPDKTNILDILQITVVSILLMVQTETSASEDILDVDMVNLTEHIDNRRTSAFGIPLHGVFAFFVYQHIHVFYDKMVFEDYGTRFILSEHQGGFIEFFFIGDFGTFHRHTDYLGGEQVLSTVNFDTVDGEIGMILMTVENEIGDFKGGINGFVEDRYVKDFANHEGSRIFCDFLVKGGREIVGKMHRIVGTRGVTVDEIVECEADHRRIGMFSCEREEMGMGCLEMGVVFFGDDELKGDFGFHIVLDPEVEKNVSIVFGGIFYVEKGEHRLFFICEIPKKKWRLFSILVFCFVFSLDDFC